MMAKGPPSPHSQTVGPNIPSTTLDLHANLTSCMVNNADCLFGYDTNPHVDMYERAQESFEALIDIWEGNNTFYASF